MDDDAKVFVDLEVRVWVESDTVLSVPEVERSDGCVCMCCGLFDDGASCDAADLMVSSIFGVVIMMMLICYGFCYATVLTVIQKVVWLAS